MAQGWRGAPPRRLIPPSVLASWGLPGLFTAAFLAGSVVPFPSEAALVALLRLGSPLPAALATATVGNVLGAATLFWLGRLAARGAGGRLARSLTSRDPEAIEKARARLARWGAPLLLLTWLPIVGDVIVIAAGYAGTGTLPFLLFTTAGKLIRFGAVALAATAAFGS